MNTFVELGYLHKDPVTKILKLGPRAIAMGHGFLRGFDFVQAVKPMVNEVSEQYRINIDTALLDSGSLLIVLRKEINNALPYQLPTIIKNLNSTALGKVVLAFLPDDERDGIIQDLPFERKTSRTILDRETLYRELGQIRQKGYALNNEEFVPGLIALGAPLISSSTGKAAGAVCFDFLAGRIDPEEIEKTFAPIITDLAERMSAILPTI